MSMTVSYGINGLRTMMSCSADYRMRKLPANFIFPSLR